MENSCARIEHKKKTFSSLEKSLQELLPSLVHVKIDWWWFHIRRKILELFGWVFIYINKLWKLLCDIITVFWLEFWFFVLKKITKKKYFWILWSEKNEKSTIIWKNSSEMKILLNGYFPKKFWQKDFIRFFFEKRFL